MKKAATILALVLSAAVAAGAPPRVAVIRVSEVFRQLESTARANEDLREKREAIDKDPRLADYEAMLPDLQAQAKHISEAGAKMDPATRKKLQREFFVKRQEAMSLLEDFENFRAERNREINAEMVEGMRERLDQIHAMARKVAEEEGYDWIFDSSGNTNTGVPLLLYAKNPDDLTDRVLAALGKNTADDVKETAENKNSTGTTR